MQVYSAIISDLDGSAILLSSHGEEVSDNTRRTIIQAKNNGHIIAVATGRQWGFSKNALLSLGITSPSIFDGGSSICDPKTDEVLWEERMDPSTANAVLDVFTRHADGNEVLFAQDGNHKIATKETCSKSQRYLYLIDATHYVAQKVVDEINTLGIAEAHGTPSWKGTGHTDVHVTSLLANKETAVVQWLRMHKLTKDEVVGFGDSGNDVPLFSAVRLKVASGHATPEIRAIADYIAPAPDEDGLAHVINKFLLNKK